MISRSFEIQYLKNYKSFLIIKFLDDSQIYKFESQWLSDVCCPYGFSRSAINTLITKILKRIFGQVYYTRSRQNLQCNLRI